MWQARPHGSLRAADSCVRAYAADPLVDSGSMLRFMGLLLGSLWLLLSAPSFSMGQSQPTFAAQMLAAHPSLYLNFNEPSPTFRDQVSGAVFLDSRSGTILAHQPGFDNTDAGNTSASLTHDAYLAAPDQPGRLLMGSALHSVAKSRPARSASGCFAQHGHGSVHERGSADGVLHAVCAEQQQHLAAML